MITNGMALLIPFVLGEDATEINLAGLGTAVGLLARAACQFVFAHGHTGAVAADIHDGGVAWIGRSFLFGPGLGCGANPLNGALNLPGGNLDAAGFLQMFLGFLETGFVGALQAEQAKKRGSAAGLQRQRRVDRSVSALILGLVIVGAGQDAWAENALDLDWNASFEVHPRLGLIFAVDLIGGIAQQSLENFARRFKKSGAEEQLQIAQGQPVGRTGGKSINYASDFLVFGERELAWALFFFFEWAAISARVLSMIWLAYSSVRAVKS